MPQAKSAEMVSPNDVTVSTTAGYTIAFKAGEPTYVPALAVSECMKAGARQVKRYSNTATNVPAVNTKGQITSEVTIPDEALESVEEVILNTDTDTQNRQDRSEPKRNEKTFTEAETRIKNAITRIIERGEPEDWTNGVPKVSVLSREVDGMSVTAGMREKVWNKMAEAGLIPDDYQDTIGI